MNIILCLVCDLVNGARCKSQVLLGDSGKSKLFLSESLHVGRAATKLIEISEEVGVAFSVERIPGIPL